MTVRRFAVSIWISKRARSSFFSGRAVRVRPLTFNLIAGLDVPTKGRIEIDGQDLAVLGEAGRTLLRRNKLGFVFQFFNLLPTLTASRMSFSPSN